MITSSIFKNKKILILGLGQTGLNLYKSLQMSGARVYVFDDNKGVLASLKKDKVSNIDLKKFNFNTLDYCIPSPGIPTKGKISHPIIKILKKKNIKILSELDMFQLYLNSKSDKHKNNIKVIAVTGTNGKSTVVSLINHTLKALEFKTSLVGNIGKSIFQSHKINKGFYIIEVSSYQLETTKIFKPNFSILTNLSNDHIKRHGTLKEYAKQKFKLFKSFSDNDYGIMSIDHKLTKNFVSHIKNNKSQKLITISSIDKKSNLYFDKNSIFKDNKLIYRSKNPYLFGLHNQENISNVLALLDLINLRNSISIKAINNFIGLPHRQEIIKSNKKIIIINDSKATNFESTLPALQNYKNIYWICGGIAKTKDISVVIPHLKNVRKVYIIGTTKNVFYDSFNEHIDTVYVKYLSKAISEALKDSKKNKNKVTILFSPAAASFDQYKNFETRGNSFKYHINNN
tara:strand:- start:29946 stop:31316 length:1371 start_codon:yes stop_codon:yes gene_type:complete